MSSDHSSADRGVMDTSLEIVIVAALDEHSVIGADGALPWRLPADLRHFKELTIGHPVVMGRRTYESIGHPLEQRLNIVLSSDAEYGASGCEVVSQVSQALAVAEAAGASQMMVIGGESLYRQMLPMTDRMELTIVAGTHDGDTFFPHFESDQWEVVGRDHHGADDKHPVAMTFLTLCATTEQARQVRPVTSPRELPGILQH